VQEQVRKNVSLAFTLSAGLHLIAMMTLDLAPGTWRHGVQPALKVVLRQAPPEATPSPTLAAAQLGTRQRPPKAELQEGLSAKTARSGSSMPIGERYYRNSEVDVQAVPISRGPLIFPELAYVSRLAGTVKARIYISEKGEIDSVEIVEVAPRRGIFEDAALEALRQVRYQPAQLAGQPVKSQKLIEVTFNPYEEPAPAAK
jgi:TonB family protein